MFKPGVTGEKWSSDPLINRTAKRFLYWETVGSGRTNVRWFVIVVITVALACDGTVNLQSKSLITCSEGTALAACSTPCWLQAGHSDVQVTAWPGTAVSIWGMPAGAGRQSLTTICPTHPTHSRVSCRWPELGSVAGHLLWPVHVFGTCCQHHCFWWMIVCALSVCWKHICLTEAAATH